MYRRQRSATTEPNPTESKILDAAVAVLNDVGFDRFSVPQVLERAGVSRATLYNHFADVDALIEAALVATFGQELGRSRDTINSILETSPDAATFRANLETFVTGLSRLPASVRLRRAHTLALTASRPSLAAAIGEVQDRITAEWTDSIVALQARGFIRPDVDPRRAAVLVQMPGIGRIVDDAANDPIGDDGWAAAYFEMIDRTLLTGGG